MAAPPLIYVVCSDQHRNGKTLLARVLVDYLTLEGHDPFVIDAGWPEGPLRSYFPGRTALVDFTTVPGQMKLFDTIIASPGRDYVIDLPASQTERFIAAVRDLNVLDEIRRVGFRVVLAFIVDRDASSLESAILMERAIRPDLLMPVANDITGSALPRGYSGVKARMYKLPPELLAIIAHKRFSFRAYLLDEQKAAVPEALRPILDAFLVGLMGAFRDIPTALSLANLPR